MSYGEINSSVEHCTRYGSRWRLIGLDVCQLPDYIHSRHVIGGAGKEASAEFAVALGTSVTMQKLRLSIEDRHEDRGQA